MEQHSVFVAVVGDRFQDLEQPSRAWTLDAVSDLRQAGGFHSYSIEFATEPTGLPPQQGMIALEHAQLGRIDVFVVPIAPWRVEAVFSELVGAIAATDAAGQDRA